jgi:alpha-N-arabinofuranosidase
LQTGNFTGVAKTTELNGKSLTSATTRTEEAASLSTREVKFKGNTINYSFPAHSFTQLEIPVK